MCLVHVGPVYTDTMYSCDTHETALPPNMKPYTKTLIMSDKKETAHG